MVDKLYLKIVFVVIAVGLDLFRQYVVTKAKQYWKINIWQSGALWIVYLVHFSIVIIASAGFTLSEVNLKSETAAVYNMEKQSIISTIKSNETEIKQLETLRDTLDPAKWQFKQTASRIDVLQKANTGHYLRLGEFKEVKINVKDDTFGKIGTVFHISSESLEIYVFIVIAILIELALIVTSRSIPVEEPNRNKSEVNNEPTTKKHEAQKEPPTKPYEVQKLPLISPSEVQKEPLTIEQEELIQFTEALYKTDNPNRLNGIERVFNDVNLTFRKCKELQDYLSSIGAIETTPGNTRAIWPKEKIIDFIKNKAA